MFYDTMRRVMKHIISFGLLVSLLICCTINVPINKYRLNLVNTSWISAGAFKLSIDEYCAQNDMLNHNDIQNTSIMNDRFIMYSDYPYPQRYDKDLLFSAKETKTGTWELKDNVLVLKFIKLDATKLTSMKNIYDIIEKYTISFHNDWEGKTELWLKGDDWNPHFAKVSR
jgi:hypothetical protein